VARDIKPSLLELPAQYFCTLLADPGWPFRNGTGKVAPEHKRLARYRTMPLLEIMALPVERITSLSLDPERTAS
jgi:hypothetical protein